MDEFEDLIRRQRSGEEESLGETAAHVSDGGQLLGFFDALGEGVHSEISGQRDDGLDDLRSTAIAADPLDEPAIDLEGVDGEALEIGERGIPGSEVIEVDLDAEVPQPAHDLHGELGDVDDGTLGDLELEAIRR